MHRKDAQQYLPLVAALAAGHTIQANRGTVDQPRWESLGDAVEFSCAPELYRADPDSTGAVKHGGAPDDAMIDRALDAYFDGDCERPHYPEHVISMRAALLAALAPQQQDVERLVAANSSG